MPAENADGSWAELNALDMEINKLRLETELEFCRKKKNRLLFLDQAGRSAK